MNNEELTTMLRQIIREEIQALHNEYLTIKEAAKFTKFSVGSLYGYVNQHRIPYIKREGKILFKRSALVKWLEEGFKEEKVANVMRVGNVRVRL